MSQLKRSSVDYKPTGKYVKNNNPYTNGSNNNDGCLPMVALFLLGLVTLITNVIMS